MKKITTIIILCTILFSVFPKEKFSLYKNNGKYGAIDKNKKIVLEAIYDEIKFNEVYLCKKNGKEYSIYDSNMSLKHNFSVDNKNVIMCSPSLFFYKTGEKVNEKSYLYNLQNNKTILAIENFIENNKIDEPWIASQYGFYSKDMIPQKVKYNRVYPFRENRAVVLNQERECEIVDEKFNIIASKILAAADYYSEGLIPVVMMEEGSNFKNPKSGESYYLDLNGDIVYKCDFDFNYIWRDTNKHIQVPEVIGSFYEGMAVVQQKDKSWMLLDKKFNKYYLPKDCTVEQNRYSNGLLLISKVINNEKKYGFIDKKSNIVVSFDYTYAEGFDGSYAIVIKDGINGVIDNKGRFTSVSDFKR